MRLAINHTKSILNHTLSSSKIRLKPFKPSFPSDPADTEGHIRVTRTLILQVVRDVSRKDNVSYIAAMNMLKIDIVINNTHYNFIIMILFTIYSKRKLDK